jgi:hypothetical protein
VTEVVLIVSGTMLPVKYNLIMAIAKGKAPNSVAGIYAKKRGDTLQCKNNITV